MSEFGDRLRKIRRSADVTQQQLADFLGLTYSAVAKYEDAAGTYPSVSSLIKIADFFQVSIDYLLRGTVSAKNNVSGALTNSTVIQGNTTLHGEKHVSPEAAELLNIYDSLSVRERLKLLNFAVNLEDRSKKREAGAE